MKSSAAAVLVLLFLQSSAGAAPQQLQASIEGAVYSVGNGMPIRAQISLTPADAAPVAPRGGARGGARAAGSVTTDSFGKFVMRDIAPGTYQITVVANGFVKQEFGQLIEGGRGKPIRLAAGQLLKDVVVRLTPTGAVSGRISDDSRGAAVGADVQILRVVWNASGQKTLVPVGTTKSDDRGEYRLFGLSPGRYFLAAGTLGRPLYQLVYTTYWGTGPGIPLRPANNNVVEQLYGVTFYPGVTELKDAMPVDVQPGGETRGMDLVVPRQQPHQIRGRVVDARSGQNLEAAYITLALLNFRDEVVFSSPAGGTASATGTNGRVYEPGKGFELLSISPGAVIITAEPAEADVAPRDRAAKRWPSAFAALNITNSDVNDVVLTLEDPLSIAGRVVVEGGDAATAAGLDRMKVRLMPLDGLFERWLSETCARLAATNDIRCIPMPRSDPVKANGSFQIDNMKRGRFKVTLDSVPPDFYVKEVRFDKKDILNSPLQFSGPVPEPMEVVLSSKPAQISGSAEIPNAQVVLIPDENRNRIELFKSVATDAAGRFSIRGIAPGDYKIYAWEAIEPYAYFDPDFVQRFQSNAKAIHIVESDNLTLELKVIPAN